jgi:hypothetical protein
MCLVKATGGTHPWLVIKVYGFRLYSGDDKKHGIFILFFLCILPALWNAEPLPPGCLFASVSKFILIKIVLQRNYFFVFFTLIDPQVF